MIENYHWICDTDCETCTLCPKVYNDNALYDSCKNCELKNECPCDEE